MSRIIAVPAMAVLLGSGSRVCGLGLEGECRIIQDTLAPWTDEALGDSGIGNSTGIGEVV